MTLRVMLVEDDPAVRESIADMLNEEGQEVTSVDAAESAQGRMSEADPDLR